MLYFLYLHTLPRVNLAQPKFRSAAHEYDSNSLCPTLPTALAGAAREGKVKGTARRRREAPLLVSLSPCLPLLPALLQLSCCLAALATKDSIKKVSKGKMRIIKTNQHVVFVPCQKRSRAEPIRAESSRRSRSQAGTKRVAGQAQHVRAER